MYLRISSLALLAVLGAGCGEPSEAPQGDTIACAIGPGAELSESCVLERVSADEFVIHQPDGGFRRFVRTGGLDEPPLASTDGADSVRDVAFDEATGEWEFALGQNRYRLIIRLIGDQATDE